MPNLKFISPRWKGIFAALLSSALVALSMPGRPFPFLAWIALVPLAFALRNARVRDGILFAGVFGFLFWITSIWWIERPIRELLQFSPGASWMLTILGCAISALPYAVAGAIASLASSINSPVLRAAKNAAIFTVAISWCPQVFDGNFVAGQYQTSLVIQVVDIGGMALLLFLICWVNWLLAECIAARAKLKAALKPALVFCAILVGIFGYGSFRLHDFSMQLKTAPKDAWFTVGAIQPNVPVPIAAERQPVSSSELTNNFFSSLEQADALVKIHPEIDLLAFPESPDFFSFRTDAERRNALAKMISRTGKPVVFNASLLDAKKQFAGNPAVYNIDIFVDASGTVTNSYRKMKLVPVVESLLYEEQFPWLRKVFPRSIGVLPGAEPKVFEVKRGVRVMPLICYEATRSAFARQFVKKGGNVILNLVNDSWFLKTPASESHLALALFRAVEFRVPMIRVTNSGVGAFIQADGEIVPGSRTALFEKAAGAFPVYIPAQRSFYAKYGNVFLVVLTFALGGVLIGDAWKFLANRRTKLQPRRNRLSPEFSSYSSNDRL